MKKEILTTKENDRHEIQIVKIDSVVLELLKSKNAPKNADFLPANAVDLHGKRLWDFKAEEFNGFGKLLEFRGEYYIYLEDRQRVVHRVIPVSDLPKLQKVKLGDKIIALGGTSPENLLRLKIEIADYLSQNYSTTAEEDSILLEMQKLRQAEAERERLRKQEELNAKEQARSQRLAEITGRDKITAYTADGKPRYGIPVISEDEWKMLPDNTAIVVVNNLEERNPIEAFFVKKTVGGRISKSSVKEVFPKKPFVSKIQKDEPTIEASGIIQVVIDNQVRQILNFSKENFNRLRATGLNSGTMVAVGEPSKDGRYTIVKMKGNECLTVGEFPQAA